MATTLNKPYTSLNKVKMECKFRLADTEKDDWFKECINDASRHVEEYTGRSFWYDDARTAGKLVLASWVQGDTIYVPTPIISLASVNVDSEAIDEDKYVHVYTEHDKYSKVALTGSQNWTELNSNILAEDGEESPYREYSEADFPIRLYGEFGYAIVDVTTAPVDLPFSIVRATTLIASALSGENRKQNMPLDGGEPIEFTEYRIPKEAKELMDKYKDVVM